MFFKTRPQIEYIDVAGHREIRILPYGDYKQLLFKKMSFEFKSEEDIPSIKNVVQEFIKGQKDFSDQYCDVILTTDKQFAVSLMLPRISKSKMDLFIRNDLQDKFGEKYQDKFLVIPIPNRYHKDGIMNVTYLIEKRVVKDVRTLIEGLGLKVHAICPISVLEARSIPHIDKASSNRIALDIRNNYTLSNIYISDVLVESFILPFSLNSYKTLNNMEKAKANEDLYRKVIAAVGREEFANAKGKTDQLVIRCSNKGVGERIAKANPLKLDYAVISSRQEYYDYKIFNQLPRPYMKESLVNAYTMMEVVVALAVSAVMIGTITMAVIGINAINTRTIIKEKAGFYLNQVSELYQSENNLKNVFFSSEDLNADKTIYVNYIGGNFSSVTSIPNSYLFQFTYDEATLPVNGKTAYTLTISNLKDSRTTLVTKQIIKAIR
ncbi:MAG: hypothetical protein LKJ88_02745 [Bacilli bacterium]|jgi:hypothetical protein|nr:hypothetical protein [Bacilli bacterium]